MTKTLREAPFGSGSPGRLAVAVLLALAVLGSGALWAFLRLRADERESTVAVWEARLSAAAEARKAAIEVWLDERRADAEVLAWDDDLVNLCIEPTCPKGLDLSRAQSHLDHLVRFGGLLGAYLYSPSGDELLEAENGILACSEIPHKIREVARTGRFVLHDLHRSRKSGQLMMGFLAPVFRRGGEVPRAGARVLGVVGLYVNPEERLFPLLVGGATGEPEVDLYLVGRQGAGARILSPPRGTPGWETLGPQRGQDSVEVAALGPGIAGAFRDFRGHRVLAAARRIPAAGWSAVASIDEDVALAAWRREARNEAAIGGLGVLCLALVGVALWRAGSARRYRTLLEGLKDREARLRALAFGTDDLVFVKDRAGRYLLVNPATARLLGVTETEAVGRSVEEFLDPGVAGPLSAHDDQVLKTGKPFQGEEEIPIQGESRTFLSARIPIRDSVGEVQGVAGVLRDITDRKRGEQATARRVQSLAALYRLSETFALARDPGHVLEQALDTVVDALGLDGLGVFLCTPGDRGLSLVAHRSFREVFEAVASEREPRGVSGRVFRTGQPWFVEDYASDPDALSEDSGGGELASAACVPLQADGRRLGVLAAAYRTRRVFDSEERGVLEALGHMMGVALSRAQAQVALAEEATERRRAEQRLRRLHESTAGLTGRHLFCATARALGDEIRVRWVDVIELLPGGWGRPLVAFEDGRERLQAPFVLAGTPGGEVVEGARFRWHGQEVWRLFPADEDLRRQRVEFYAAAPLLDSAGGVVGVLCAYHDAPLALTAAEEDLCGLYARRVAGEVERVRTEGRLTEARRALDTVVQNLPGAVYRSRCGPDRAVEQVSPGCEAITGYPAEAFAAAGLSLTDLVLAEDRARVAREVDAAVEGGHPYELEYRIHDRAGTVRWVFDVGRPVTTTGGGLVLEGVLLDYTERRTLEAQLTHSQRMEALGRLAGGVAHDFNNLLTAISGYTEILHRRLPEGDRSHRAVEEIGRAADRAAELTRQLLSFSRRQTVDPKVLDFNEAVTGTLGMLGRLLGEDVELSVDLGPDVGAVRADSAQVEQVILNLCVNARDAMPEGGRLTVRTAVEPAGAAQDAQRGHRTACRSVVLEVSDTGTGIPADVVEHIFEPFFTTKEAGKGTGLGLATVYGVVTQAGGQISVSSAPGRGSCFRVLWPGCDAAAGVPEVVAEVVAALPGGGRQVLLAEDEESVRSLASSFLTEMGYAVCAVESGEAAVAAADGGRGLDVLVTDVVMAGMSGPDLALALRRHKPDLPVIFISGYTGDVLVERGADGPGTAFLQKPFRLTDLSRAVEVALGG
ncbi:MAG: PAS domain-containing protein [Deltaproteobacteria bacterium]|nr:PAS domain-containing protein [Deltaproteobacteria bacterium]